MNLVPNTTYTLIRQLANPTDTQTYYVQAVVRNIITGKTIKTINLVNQGGQRFTAPYQVPADTSGQGTYISICTYVFDDAGYSVPDGNYETEDKEYLIIQPPVSTYGNGGTTIVDYDKIKKYISDIKFPGIPTYDRQFKEMREYHEGRFNELTGYVDKAVKGIKMPVYEDSEVRSSIASLRRELEMTKKSHESAIKAMSDSHAMAINNLRLYHEQVMKVVNDQLTKVFNRPFAAEKERDDISKEHEQLKRNFDTVMRTVNAIQIGEYEKPKDTTDQRVKKLLGI